VARQSGRRKTLGVSRRAAPEPQRQVVVDRGSSAINAMVFGRGHKSSYDHWEKTGVTGWSFDDLLPYFKRSETAVGGDRALRGTTGPLLVSASEPCELADAWLSEAVESGHGRATDISGGLEFGFGPVDLNIVAGRRQSAADAYLVPALHRHNLDFVASALVHRVQFEGDRCTGVEYSAEDGATVTVSTGEVVLTAGAIGSPQLLLQSGVGPHDHLRDVGVEVVHNLPGVGANLHDHPLAAITYRAAAPSRIPKTITARSLVW
jgi:choline dehydrogenase